MEEVTKQKDLEHIVGGLDGLTQKIRGFSDTPTFKLLTHSLQKTANDYYHANEDPKTGELKLNETKARKLAGELFEVAGEHIAVNYLKLKAAEIKRLKNEIDPATGKPQWESFIRDHLGIDKDGIYETLKTRRVVRPNEIDSLVKPIYDAHVNAFITKAATTYIDSIEKAMAVLDYLRELQKAQPKTFEGLNIPTSVKSTDEAIRLYVSAIQLLSRDYKPEIAKTAPKANPGEYKTLANPVPANQVGYQPAA